MPVHSGADLCRDESGVEEDDADGNDTGTCRVATPRCLCAFGYLQRMSALQKVVVRKEPFQKQKYILIHFWELKFYPCLTPRGSHRSRPAKVIFVEKRSLEIMGSFYPEQNLCHKTSENEFLFQWAPWGLKNKYLRILGVVKVDKNL